MTNAALREGRNLSAQMTVGERGGSIATKVSWEGMADVMVASIG
jgi:hypothetical protein